MRTEYKFERGNLSQQGECLESRLDVNVGKVTYVFFDDDNIGWIPAKEGIAKTLLPGVYSGYLTNDNTIAVDFAKSDLISMQGYQDYIYEDDEKMLCQQDTNKQNTFTPGTGVSSTKPQTMLQNLIETNKQAAKQAAYLEAGRLANETLSNIMAKKFPNLPQTPFNSLILANIADQVAKNFKPNPQLAKLTTAMTTQAFLELYGMIDLDGVIAEFINGTDSIAEVEYVE